MAAPTDAKKKKWRKDTPEPAQPILDRTPPCDVSAEIAVLGSILLLPDVCDDLVMILKADDFYDDANRILYTHMTSMVDMGQKIDVTLLVNRLKSSSDYETVGGSAYLAMLANSVPNAAHAVYYAEIVRSKATFRRLIEASTSILRDAYDEAFEAKELLSQAEQKVFQIQDERSTQAANSIGDLLTSAMERIDARMKGTHSVGGVDSHFTDYDAMSGGLHNGELVILAARPSMGKTAFALNVAENVALLSRAPVLFVSLEMSGIELADRLLCSVARVNGHQLRNGSISQDDRKRLVEKAVEISNAPLYVDDSPSRTVSEIAAVARRIRQREKALGLIVIDYLQLIEPDNPKDPRQEQVAKIARRLKGLAREAKVPLLCLAQLNRQAEEGKDHRPKLSQLRESGAIEQDADVVMFVHREEYYHRGDEGSQFAGQAEIIIAKQRNGPVGDVLLTWEKEYTRFRDRSPERHSEFDNFSDFQAPGGF
ncbi:replicative DNA helicase [Aureliella helgolandensis]|uniref:Replicative DNA helicase n=1 Tax=Aureliella helgolandensis TaxID=2527968 RepID=A0A518GDL9_9BACT|nr:replicative DNA helicase [Aureliella helgolandensis]QDV26705.1 Replicative DNA helicase [Aureliella helgolandensis]